MEFSVHFFILGGGITQRRKEMKRLYGTFESVEAAVAVVNSLMTDGISAYRQGLQVFVDDGGYDWGL